ARVLYRSRPLRDGRRLFALDVRHAEPTAHAQLVEPERREPRGQRLDLRVEGPEPEDLAPDVGVHARKLHHAGRLERPGAGDGLVGRPAGEAEPELRVVLPRPHELVGVRLDTGCHPDEHRRRAAAPGRARQALEAVELVEGVDDDAPTPAETAALSSASDLLLPWSTRRSAGTPALRATWSSPPVDTSRHRPSSWASAAMARQRNAFVAYAVPSPHASRASRQRARRCASSYTNTGVPVSAARSTRSTPPTRRCPSPSTSDVSGNSERGTGPLSGPLPTATPRARGGRQGRTAWSRSRRLPRRAPR